MKQIDIVESLAKNVENIIFKEWKHEGYIGVTEREGFYCDIDGVLYRIDVTIVPEEEEAAPEKSVEMIETSLRK